MSGLVGIIANDAARFSLFTSCVLKSRYPEGTQVEVLIGGDWCGARNSLVELTLESEADWLWFMDDDHAFSPSLLPDSRRRKSQRCSGGLSSRSRK